MIRFIGSLVSAGVLNKSMTRFISSWCSFQFEIFSFIRRNTANGVELVDIKGEI
jgi:hypothetical protein